MRRNVSSATYITMSRPQVCLAGNYVTVLLDPHSFDAVINDTTALDYSLLRDKLLRRIFSLQLSELRPAEERKWMEQ